ncbi:MAG: lipoprotein-releasing ABC transporter ATP-binding protein LolD [Burkholderiales bacterium]|jgi:lipoprotein-releasing system ATP-binding protein|nr:lipoprotein-releasing ABC transporter ATP-binding protein LolD [Burkholderiales bacterium]
MSNPLILEAVHLAKTYKSGKLTVPVLHDVNLSLSASDTVAIVGSSGSGKSTLLHLLGGLDEITSGRVLLLGQDIAKIGEREKGMIRNRALGFVYQFHHLLPEFSALENVMMPLLIRRESKAAARDAAATVLGRVGLAHRVRHVPGELSGGERQRVALARALVTRPRCILADEPTGNLDRATANQVFDLMLTLNQEYKTALVIVTHDNELAARAQKTFHLVDGVIRA